MFIKCLFVDRLELSGDGSEHDVTVTCLSCPTAEDDDSTSCRFVDARFSPSAEFYVDACLGPQLPRYVLKSTADHVQRNHLHLRRDSYYKAKARHRFLSIAYLRLHDDSNLYSIILVLKKTFS